MYFILYILSLSLTGRLRLVKSERGDCSEFPPMQDQNLLFDRSLLVDPCGSRTKAVKCLSGDSCTLLSLDPANCPYSISLNQDTTATPNKTVLKVEVSVPPSSEFFIEAYPTSEDGEIVSESFILGSFEDVLHTNCSSYACCDLKDSTVRDVARKCPVSDRDSMPESTPYTFLWFPPKEYVGFIVFVGYFFKSDSEHWEQVTSDILQLGVSADNTGEEETKIPTQTQDIPAEPEPNSNPIPAVSALPSPPVAVKSNQPTDSSGFSLPSKVAESNKAALAGHHMNNHMKGRSRNVGFSGDETGNDDDDDRSDQPTSNLRSKKVSTRRNKLMATERNMTGLEIAGIRIDVNDLL